MIAKRILYVIASLQGGAATHLVDLASGALAAGWRPEVVGPADEPSLAERLNRLGIPLHPMPLDTGFRPAILGELESLLRARDPELIHIHGLRAGLYGRLAAHLANRTESTVLTLHGFHVPFYENRLKRMLGLAVERQICHLARTTVCVSAFDRIRYSRSVTGGEAEWVRMVRNGIDIPRFATDLTRAEARRRFSFPPDAFILGCASRLRPQKDPATLIYAFAEFRRKHPRSMLAFAGDGPLREALIEQCRDLGLAEKVRFFSVVKDMPAFYRSLDVFCLASKWEGLPLSLMEAMAAGIPIVATEVPGTVEVVTHMEHGLLAPAGRPGAFAKALHCSVTNPADARRMVERAGQRVRECFSLERMIAETLDIYEEMASNRKNA